MAKTAARIFFFFFAILTSQTSLPGSDQHEQWLRGSDLNSAVKSDGILEASES